MSIDEKIRSISDEIAEEHGLKKRQKEILFYMIKGYSSDEIAKELWISPKTAKGHASNITLATRANRQKLQAQVIEKLARELLREVSG